MEQQRLQLRDECQSVFGWPANLADQVTGDLSEINVQRLSNSPKSNVVETEWTSNALINMAWRLGKEINIMDLPDYSLFQGSITATQGDQDLPKLCSISLLDGQSLDILKEGIFLNCAEVKKIASRYFADTRELDLIVLSEIGCPLLDPLTATKVLLVDVSTQDRLAHWIQDLQIRVYQDLDLIHQEVLPMMFSELEAGRFIQALLGGHFPIARKEGALQNLALALSMRKNSIVSNSKLLIQLPNGLRIVGVMQIDTLAKTLFPLHPEITVQELRDSIQERLPLKKKNYLLLCQPTVDFESKSLVLTSAILPNRCIISLLEWD